MNNRLLKNILFVLVFLCVSGHASWAADATLYSVQIRNAPVSDIVRMLAQLDGKNVVISDKIEGTVTASFKSIHLEDALESILDANDLGFVIRDDVIRVTTRKDIQEMGEDLQIRTIPLKFAKVDKVSEQVQSLISERGSVMVDERTNAISVRDTLTKINDILRLIENIDKKDRQVLIEAKIVEASTEFIRSVGIQWGVTRTGGDVGIAGLSDVGAADSGNALNLDTPASGLSGTNPYSGVALALGSFGGVVTDVQLTAAEEHGDLNILSRPSVVTLNNQEAKIHSGVQFYIQTSGDVTISSGSSNTSTSSNLQQVDAGITMTVTPQITISDKINLVIDVTESQVDFTQQVNNIPTIIDNSASTSVLLNDGEITVIGGLFQIQKQNVRQGIPLLHRIPLFGALFRNTTRSKSKSELIIFIKPSIVKEGLAQLPSYPEDDAPTEKNTKTVRKKKGKWR